MNIVMKKTSELIPYARNNKIHSESQIKLIASSILEFGFKQPIVVDSKNSIVAGHGRLKGAKLAGLEEVPCIIADDLTKAQIKAYRIADNKLSDLAEWDNEMIGLELEELGELDFDISLTGFDIDELEALSNVIEGSLVNEIDKDEEKNTSLVERFLVPPFSVFDTKQSYWQDRKRMWKKLIKDEAQARSGAIANSNKGWSYGTCDSAKMSEVSLLDPVMAEIVCKWFGIERGLNIDCFAGDSYFGAVSGLLGYDFRGLELRKEQTDFNNNVALENCIQEKTKYFCDDGENILNHIKESSADLLFSCPPYFNLENYNGGENDLSGMGHKQFLEKYTKILHNALKCLKNDRFAVIVIGDVRDKKGNYINLIADTKDAMISGGCNLYNEIILLDHIGNAALRAGSYMKNRKVVKVHQNILVFFKGDNKNIKEIYKDVEVMEFEGDDME